MQCCVCISTKGLIEDTCYTVSLHAMCIVDQNVYDKSPLHAILNIQSEYILINCVYSIAIHNIQAFLQTCCRKLFAHWVCLCNKKITVHKYRYLGDFFTLCAMVFTWRLAVFWTTTYGSFVLCDSIMWENTNVIHFLCNMSKFSTCPINKAFDWRPTPYSLDKCCIFPYRTQINTSCIS